MIQIHSVDGREISVSRSVFRKCSPRIKSMLNPYLDNVSITVYLPYTYKNIKIIDEFMKNQRLEFYSLKHAMDVYRISRKLCMFVLNDCCRTRIAQPTHIPHVCEIYEFACEIHDFRLQFYCWKKFSDDWNTVFYQNKNALDCDEIVIRKLLSRPIYRNLDEMTIFKIVYEWARRRVNSKTTMRQVMDPFLLNIRFLTMDDGFLKSYIYPKQFLTEEEVNAIQHYKATSDKSIIPDSISRSHLSRNDEKHSFWFIYCNRSYSIHDQEMNMENKFQFISEIFVLEDCFLTGIELPISHNSEKRIRIRIQKFIDNGIWNPEKENYVSCDQNGKIKLYRVNYISKSSTFRVIAKINEEDILRSNIRISNSASRYIVNEGMAISSEKSAPSCTDIEYIYCNVNLYF
ncbi:uncharacterized protein LOC111621997 isoform X4 [Centruroides sculpturatus]|uniref:uncharacterized protein LOC111621997 isoform X3 n=1 Tax=Centruroides sculpturatus TaxID=218467 RepID=UPI000C6E5C88|nr:uncharacterized protein LOC111621997 isoform X3 [Centruroides sculpturatus]XP_023220084.1 uncharacterized protein LOC111621997 isoform X4 [Centruroides sculpturatus]